MKKMKNDFKKIYINYYKIICHIYKYKYFIDKLNMQYVYKH